MKLFKNRYVIGAICIIAGLLLSFVALPALFGDNQGAYTNSVRMTDSVQAGTKITADLIETVRIPENLVQNGIENFSDVIGKYANSDLYAGDYLTQAKITATLEERNALFAATEKGKMVMSITVPSLASGVSGRLMPGDIVSIIAVPKSAVNQSLGLEPGTVNQRNSVATIYPELQYLEVCMVTASDGTDANVSDDPGKEDVKNRLPATVSFYVNQNQALKLAELEQNSVIDLAFVARGQAAAQYIPDAQRVFNTGVK